MAHPLQALRDAMAEYHIDAYLIPTADFHGSEYVGAHFACREYVSGFTGSAGTLLVFANWAGLWTDGRYFLQAEEELKGSDIRLMKQGQPGVPTIEKFLRGSLQPGQTLGFDGRCVDARTGRRYHRLVRQLGAKLNHQLDLVGEIWTQRPPLSAKPAWLLEEKYAGVSRREKLGQIRAALTAEGRDVLLLTALEDIAWLLNLRGDDLPHDPVVLGYLALTREGCTLFANPAVFSPQDVDALEADGVSLRPYEGFAGYLGRLTPDQHVQLDMRRVSTSLLTAIPSEVKVTDRPDPTEKAKAVKNPVEIENMRRAHLADGIALTRFMYWLKTQAAGETVTELAAAARLEEFRQEAPLYLQPSFDPILAAGDHSAVVHYSPTPASDRPIGTRGFLLADTGGHYYTGTTDCTRTYAVGPLTPEQKTHYTAVLRGNLALAQMVFPAGCPGSSLDLAARQPLWQLGLDFNHGTGHGVGYLLSVHEGPQRIHWRPSGPQTALAPGMITSDEPGLYFDGAYGIRLENLLLCVEKDTTPFGRFLGFETLTLTPFDLDAVYPEEMSVQERQWLNDYHARVRAALAPHLPPAEAAWLQTATRPI